MPSSYDTIHSTETNLLEHFESTPIFYALMIISCFIFKIYLNSQERCAASELFLFTGSLYVATLFIVQNTWYADELLYALWMLCFLVQIYTNIFSKGPDYDSKLPAVTCILMVAWLVSWLCVSRLQGHRFSAMWVSKNWHRKLGFLQDCMGATYAYCTHTVPHHVKTIFLKRQFIDKWFVTMYWGAAGVVIALWVSIWVVKRDSEISTEHKNKIQTREATIEEQKATIQEQKATIEEQKATIQEQKATIEEHVATIEEQKATIEEHVATIEEQKATIEEQKATIEEHKATIEEQKATIEEQKATIEEQKATIQKNEATIQKNEANIQKKEANIQEHDDEMKAFEELQDKLLTALTEAREENRVFWERDAILQTNLAEAVACNAMLKTNLAEAVADNAVLQTDLAEAVADKHVLTKRNAVLQTEAAEAGARKPQP